MNKAQARRQSHHKSRGKRPKLPPRNKGSKTDQIYKSSKMYLGWKW